MYKSATLFVTLSLLAISLNCRADEPKATTEEDAAKPKVEIIHLFKPENCARHAKLTDLLTLHYKGTLEKTGEEFDSSYTHKQPFTFQLGIGQVIKGWDQGLLNVCIGEKLKLVVPPELGYGKSGLDKIPANSALVFEVEILHIADGPNPVNVFKDIDVNADGRLSREEVGEFLKKQLSLSGQDNGAAGQDPDSILNEVFSHEDADGDGFISRSEFSGPKHDHDEL